MYDEKWLKTLADALKDVGEGMICEPTERQMKQLAEGSGRPDGEMRLAHSSAGLAVNFWRQYELRHPGTSVEFEWKGYPLPLHRENDRPANVDVVVRGDDAVRFVESKYLEPYYSTNEAPAASYMDPSKYRADLAGGPEPWICLFERCGEFEFFGATQLCRHLLAVFNAVETEGECDGKDVVLCCAFWDMPDAFVERFPVAVAEELRRRREKIREEAVRFRRLLDHWFLDLYRFRNRTRRGIGMETRVFVPRYETLKYNDLIAEISDPDLRAKFAKRYCLA